MFECLFCSMFRKVAGRKRNDTVYCVVYKKDGYLYMSCRKLCCRTIRLGMIFLTVVVVALAFTIVNETHEARKNSNPQNIIFN